MTDNISFIQGDLFETDMETIVITVNCKGVMGKGIALRLKKTAKPAYEKYRELCDAGEMNMGKSVIYNEPIDVLQGKTILFFPTKFHWKNNSNLFQIKDGLEHCTNDRGLGGSFTAGLGRGGEARGGQ